MSNVLSYFRRNAPLVIEGCASLFTKNAPLFTLGRPAAGGDVPEDIYGLAIYGTSQYHDSSDTYAVAQYGAAVYA
jgi:hypothetical protein